MTRHGASGSLSRSAARTSGPSMSGRRTLRTMASKHSPRAAVTASTPVSTVTTSYPAWSNARSQTTRTVLSSSHTSTRWRPNAFTWSRTFDQTLADGVAREARDVVDVELLHDVHAVGL